ncbi:MAG: ABC transporter permease subunit [Actinomycetota bacterium]|nr:ABC transporter permease subunit [Actinomycetota bacterium]
MTISATTPQKRLSVATSARRAKAPRWLLVMAVVAVWVVGWIFLRGQQTLTLDTADTTSLHDWITTHVNDFETGNGAVIRFTYAVGSHAQSVITWFQELLSIPAFPRPVPQIGWFGVVALAGWVALATAGWRIAVFVVLCFMSFGVLGFWQVSMDTLIVTFCAVGVALLVGLPLGVWMGNSGWATTLVTPVLDVMQTIPSFVYLTPMIVLFGIGAQAAVLVTLIYCLPPVVRISAHGVRTVSAAALEATDSLGQTRWQRLTKVQMPMAKRTIIVGINQTMLAALSMATIAALINGPGLGQPVVQALNALLIGQAFVPGLAIVVMAIMLDRTTTAISERSERLARAGGGNRKVRRWVLAGTGVAALVAVYLSRTYLQLATFPSGLDFGTTLAGWIQSASDWVATHVDTVTNGFKDKVSYLLLNPLQDLLANSPWWLVAGAILALAAILGGRWAVASTVACLAGIYYLDMWSDTMLTLTTVLVATVLVMALAVVLGVWMGRSRVVDRVLRPLLDAGQTMPPFVYLVPVLALFGPTRFTAIVAAIIYAAPVSVKLVADGIRGVSATTLEAAESAGSTRLQLIMKVQLPMARSSLALAANQGLLFVLSMVVIGGLVGGGALGYDIVQGFSQSGYAGKGIAAGASVALLGIMLDRITRRAAQGEAANAAHQ